MRRARVLSRYGLHTAADRWEEAFGAKTADGPGRAGGVRQLRVPGADRRARSGRPSGSARTSSRRRTGGWSRWRTAAAGTRRRRSCRSRRARPRRVLDETRVDPFPLRPAPDSGSVSVGPDGDRVRGGPGPLVGRGSRFAVRRSGGSAVRRSRAARVRPCADGCGRVRADEEAGGPRPCSFRGAGNRARSPTPTRTRRRTRYPPTPWASCRSQRGDPVPSCPPGDREK